MRQNKTHELRVPDELAAHEPLTILEWLVREGESFAAEQALVDLVAPGGVHPIFAPQPGQLTEILVEAGSSVSAGETVALCAAVT